jgi:hypothetical protein
VGNVYYAGIAFNITGTTGQGNGNMAAFVAKYTNDGSVYSGVTIIPGGLFADKPWIAVDTSGGPFDGNVYLVFDANLPNSPYATVLTHSSDGGKTFAPPVYVAPDQSGLLPGVSVDSSGNVYVSSDVFKIVNSLPVLDYIQVAKIAGATFVGDVKAVSSPVDLPSTLPGGRFRTATIPQIAADAAGIYLVWDDYASGRANIFFTRSIDGGLTWATPSMIDDHSEGQHFFPTVSVAGGIINVAWYDSRFNIGSNITALDVFYANSLDHGLSFSANMRVTSTSFNPNAVLRSDFGDPGGSYFDPFIGDYLQIASNPTATHVIWTDNRFANDTSDSIYGTVDQDALTATINLPDFSITPEPASLSLTQGQTGNANVTLASLFGFSGNVTIAVSISPDGLTPITQPPLSVNVSPDTNRFFLLYFSPTVTTPARAYTLSIIGSSGPRVHTAKFSVTVQPFASFPSPGSIRFPSFNGPNPIYAYVGAAFVMVGIAFVAGLLIFHMLKRRRAPPPAIPTPIN